MKSMIGLNTKLGKVTGMTNIGGESYVFLDDNGFISLFPKDAISKESNRQPKEEYET